MVEELELSCCKKQQKIPNQETGLGIRKCMKVLNDTKFRGWNVLQIFNSPLVILNADLYRRSKASSNKFFSLNTISKAFLRLIIIVFFPLVPAIIIISSENAKEERKNLKSKDRSMQDLAKVSILERCQLLTEFIEECRKALLTFKRNELSMELVIQMSIHLTMLLLSKTDYPIESGLQSIFQVRPLNFWGSPKLLDAPWGSFILPNNH